MVTSLAVKIGGSTLSGASSVTYRPMDAGMGSWTAGNGLPATLGYDTDNRLTAISVPGVQSLSFTYDNADRIAQVGNGIDGSLTQYFGYDEESRLRSVYSSADNESFQYDANGNRLMQSGTINAISATSNQLVSTAATSTATTRWATPLP